MARRYQRTDSGHVILVVDDQEEARSSLRRLLEEEGHRVLTASSGEEALAVLRQQDVHLLVIDYVMPRMSGGELVQRIRETDLYVQIVLQTGYAGERPPREILVALDIQGYHAKGDDPEQLLMWVDVGLKTHRLLGRLRERERLHGEMVANCSHEFRTPLNIIAGYAEMLAGDAFGSLPDEGRQVARTMLETTRDLSRLVEDFLAFARAEAGVASIAPAPVAVAALADELERLAAVLLVERPVAFSIDTTSAPAVIVTDGLKLRTILRNLLTNAAKFTSAGRVGVRVARDGEVIRIDVSDTGCGIRAEETEAIFEPFRQLDGSSTRAASGIGLGLALARRLAGLLGATIEVQSEVGVGSTFTLRLPAAGGDGAVVVGAGDHGSDAPFGRRRMAAPG